MENGSSSLPLICGDLPAEVGEPGLVMLLAQQALGAASMSTSAQEHTVGTTAALIGQPAFIPPTALGQELDQLDVVTSTFLLFLSIGPEWPLNSSPVA